MLTRLKSNWRQLKQGKPGRRFIDRFDRRHQATKGRLHVRKFLNIGLGMVLTLGGLIFLPAPGPGSIVLIIGLGLLGSEIRFIAQFLDWGEVRLRKWIRQLMSFWKHASLALKILMCLLAIVSTGAACYVAFRWYVAL